MNAEPCPHTLEQGISKVFLFCRKVEKLQTRRHSSLSPVKELTETCNIHKKTPAKLTFLLEVFFTVVAAFVFRVFFWWARLGICFFPSFLVKIINVRIIKTKKIEKFTALTGTKDSSESSKITSSCCTGPFSLFEGRLFSASSFVVRFP